MTLVMLSVLAHALSAAGVVVAVAVAGWWFDPPRGSLVRDSGWAARATGELLLMVIYQHWAAPNLFG